MTNPLRERIGAALNHTINPLVAEYARLLADEAGAIGVIFYGSNLRTGSLEGVLDFYLLLPGDQENTIWPRVSYREWEHDGAVLRAKIASMTLVTFAQAASGKLIDTTIWARFVQPCAIIWTRDDQVQSDLLDALESAAKTAARLAVALGPDEGTEWQFWKSLFRATYSAELRVEKAGRENVILETHRAHFTRYLPQALEAQGIDCPRTGAIVGEGNIYAPEMDASRREAIIEWWNTRRLWGKPLNVVRLIRATATFDGAARYGAWKVERHTGAKISLTQWQEDHPILGAPAFVWKVWRAKRDAGK